MACLAVCQYILDTSLWSHRTIKVNAEYYFEAYQHIKQEVHITFDVICALCWCEPCCYADDRRLQGWNTLHKLICDSWPTRWLYWIAASWVSWGSSWRGFVPMRHAQFWAAEHCLCPCSMYGQLESHFWKFGEESVKMALSLRYNLHTFY
jgi:hypothetical protein